LKDRCTFIGNVAVGQDISIADLQGAYSAVVLVGLFIFLLY